MMKTLLVEAIKEGTVIDHIPAGQAFRLIELLKLQDHTHPVTVGLNLESKSLQKKDLIKISGRILSDLEISEIAVFAENARINLIQNYLVVDKKMAKLPPELRKILLCPNQNCITHSAKRDSYFHVEVSRAGIRLHCHYCEQVFARSEIKDYAT